MTQWNDKKTLKVYDKKISKHLIFEIKIKKIEIAYRTVQNVDKGKGHRKRECIVKH